MAIKHIGRMKKSRRKVIVAYRVIPNDSNYCLVIPTEALESGDHDAIMRALESNAGQVAYEFAEVMNRERLPDGRNMLAGLHQMGKLMRIETNEVEMTPDTQTTVLLSELNNMIAEQRGVTVADLALQDNAKGASQPVEEEVVEPLTNADIQTLQEAGDTVLTDEQLAAQYRSQADALFKEAKRLREQAEDLVPTKKKTKTVESV